MLRNLWLVAPLILVQCSERLPKPIGSDQLIEIDFEYIDQKIIIPVEINQKTYRFCLDTGSKTLISDKISNQLALKAHDSTYIYDGNNAARFMSNITLDSIKIGASVFKKVDMLTAPIEKPFTCFGYDGYIGSDLLSDRIIQIDVKTKKIRMTKNINSLEINPSEGQEMILINNQKSPYTKIEIKGKNESSNDFVMIDTGMKGLYDLSMDTYERNLQRKNIIQCVANGYGSSTVGAFGLEEANEQLLLYFPSLSIGDLQIKNYVNKATYATNSRVGSKLLDYGVMTLDFVHKKFYFDPWSNQIDCKPRERHFNTTFLNENLVIGIVWNDELKNKVHLGDQILEINGTDITFKDYCELVIGPSLIKDQSQVMIKIKSKKDSIFTLTLETDFLAFE